MHSLRKSVLYVFLLLSVLGCVVSAAYFIVNAKEIPGKISKIREEQTKQDTQEKKEETLSQVGITKKFILFLKKVSIDLSAVTPIILLWFFSCIGLGCWRLIKKEEFIEEVKSDETFPFPKNYETTWIQLGFTGTLWGFLIIGLRMERARYGLGEEAIDILIKAFGTALLSTFTAVVMAYIIAPSFKGIFRWAIGIKEPPPTGVPVEITNQLRKLSKELNVTTGGVSNLKGEIESLKDKVSSLSPDAIARLIENVGNQIDNQYKEIQILRAKAEEEVKKQDEIITSLKDISKTWTSFTRQLVPKLEDLTTTIKEVSKEFQGGFEAARKDIKEEIGASSQSFFAQIKTMLSSYTAELKSFVENKIKIEFPSINKLNEKLDQNRETLEKGLHGIKNALNEIHLKRKRVSFGIVEKPKESKWYRFFLRLIGRK